MTNVSLNYLTRKISSNDKRVLRSYQEERQHVNDESKNDDRISSSFCQKVTEDSEQKSARYFADSDHDSVKSNLKTKK